MEDKIKQIKQELFIIRYEMATNSKKMSTQKKYREYMQTKLKLTKQKLAKLMLKKQKEGRKL
ncbi:MAG: hypothetical protein GX864_01860 [Mollicutes bacterium]|jgi:alpha-D-ribose 1-methylphosphonate 5-triphosphate diphosphatase PhnM|nr:hypothetical protein [Mollicutes bacterium]